MYRNKGGFLMKVIGEKTQSTQKAAEMSIQIDKTYPGFAHGFPMLWCMYGIEDKKKKENGYIYFLQSKDKKKIKIGFSKSAGKRKKQIECNEKHGLDMLLKLPGSFETENTLHDLFSIYRIGGEWYKNNEAISYYIERMQKNSLDKSLSTNDIINDVIWKMWFGILEEREYKKIIYSHDNF